jgi:hypothetical protein
VPLATAIARLALLSPVDAKATLKDCVPVKLTPVMLTPSVDVADKTPTQAAEDDARDKDTCVTLISIPKRDAESACVVARETAPEHVLYDAARPLREIESPLRVKPSVENVPDSVEHDPESTRANEPAASTAEVESATSADTE